MKAKVGRRQGRRITAVLMATFTLPAIAGCRAEDPGQEAVSLLGDLARQLLTFWIL